MTRLHSVRVLGSRVHNLRGVDVEIPHGKLTVVTGLSGSGKSSLAFDTVFAEGRRRYLESLSAYARQFVEQVPRPDVDAIEGLPPTVCIDQRTTRGGVRATVASMSEVLDYLRLLWARAGERHCERCLQPVTATTTDRIVAHLIDEATRRKSKQVHLLVPHVTRRKGFHLDVFDGLARRGVTFARVDGEKLAVEPPPELSRYHEHSIEALIESVPASNAKHERLLAAVERTLDLGRGTLCASFDDDLKDVEIQSIVAACADCGVAYRPIEIADLSWSRKHGRCKRCHGRGELKDQEGVVCPSCEGARLSPAARAIRFHGLGLHDFLALPVGEARHWLTDIEPASDRERAILDPVRHEVSARLAFVEEVGLSYLQLHRGARTLSGGESQRVRLASQLGAGLRGVCYVLDEPTIGLHPADNARLLATLRALTAKGATLLVVEHDEDTIRAADHVVDLGPGAGIHGGRVVARGTPAELESNADSVTGPWLAGRRQIKRPGAGKGTPRDWSDAPALQLFGVTSRNLQNIDVRFPVGALTCVTGVSGSGKSTLVRDVLLPAVLRALERVGPEPGPHTELRGAEHITGVLEIDQSPIGKTSRSVPATYTKIMDPLRKLFAESDGARARGFTASRFSFNSKGGRCEACQGQGRIRFEMNFLPDVTVPCETCDGKRFDEETLAVRFLGHSIADVLALPISEARELFKSFPKIKRVLDVLDEVGLGYLELGQPSPTLSGGEAQRIKLATEMSKRQRGSIVFVLDEPTTGLHFADVEKLVGVLHGLTRLGNTVVVIEHNLDVVACADLVIDLGPGGGNEGGNLVAYGTPAEVAASPLSLTGDCLRRILDRAPG